MLLYKEIELLLLLGITGIHHLGDTDFLSSAQTKYE